MRKTDKALAGTDDWDGGPLGRDEAFVKPARASHEAALDKALGLQMISVRLQRQLIDDLKFIATAHGIGYQPLIRDLLSRFVVGEKKKIIREAMERREIELNAMDGHTKLRIKVGTSEFEGEGPSDLIKEQFEAFLAVVSAAGAQQATITSAQPDQRESPPSDPKVATPGQGSLAANGLPPDSIVDLWGEECEGMCGV